MKKIVTTLLVVMMLITSAYAVTLTLIQPEGNVTMTRPAGNEITLKDVTNQIRWWKVKSGGIQIIDNKFVMPNTNVEVEAKYTGNVINVIQGANGTIAPAGPAVEVSQGGSQKFTMTPNTAYQVSNVIVDGSGQGAKTEYTFSNIQANHKITATYSPINYNIGYDYNGANTPYPSNPATYNIETPTFTLINPTRTGYQFAGWTGSNGTTPSTSVSIPKGSYGAKSYKANWTANTYTVVYNGNGATSGSTANSSHTYDVAKNLTANGYSRTGYTFKGWATSSGGAKAYDNGQSVTNLTSTNGGTVNLYAVWQINTYQITVTQGANGTISPGTTTKNYNESQTFTITPNSGYMIKDVVVDGVSQGAITSYTFSNIAAAHTITASFQETPKYTIVTITHANSNAPGVYTNHKCNVCGGYDHQCEVVNIFIKGSHVQVVEQ